MPAPLKLTSKGATLITLEIPASEGAIESSKPTFSGTPAKSLGVKKQSSTVKSSFVASEKKVKKSEPVDESDPIDVAFRDRKAAGSVESQVKEADAKKKKLQIPQPLNLKIANPKDNLITFLTDDMVEESKVTETAKAVSA